MGAASGGASATNLMGFDAAAVVSEADEANPPSSSCASSPCLEALDLPVGTLSFRLSFSPLGIVKSRAGVLSMKARAFCSSRS